MAGNSKPALNLWLKSLEFRTKLVFLTKHPITFQGTATVSEKEDSEDPHEVNEEDEDELSEEEEDEDNEVCEDRISNIAGSLSCKNFLRSFAYQYCRHKYIRKNCCASHKVYCRRGRRARQRQRLQQVPSSEVETKTSSY